MKLVLPPFPTITKYIINTKFSHKYWMYFAIVRGGRDQLTTLITYFYSTKSLFFITLFLFRLRYSDTDNIVHKQLGSTVKAYENWKECETLEKLESIKDNSNALHMESLAIRERILGRYMFDI